MNNGILFAISALLFTVGMIQYSYAEPFDDMTATVLGYDGSSAQVQLSWNSDDSSSSYNVGCVSCMPNIVQTTIESNITIENVTPFPNSSNAMLYVIAYNAENEVLNAKQIIINLTE